MGEIADMMLDGTLCEGCGVYMGESNGYPVRCGACGPLFSYQRRPNKTVQYRAVQSAQNPPKVSCPTCGKRVKSAGLADHLRDVHGVKASGGA